MADAGGPYWAVVDRDVQFSGVASRGPDAGDLAFAWNFGDGSSGTGPSPTVKYRSPGTYLVTLLASDGKDDPATAFTYVIVMRSVAGNRPPPVITRRVTTGLVYERLTFDASGSQDPDGDPLAFVWSFGDGAVASGPTVTHAYDSPGVYAVRILATDGKGGAGSTTVAAFAVPGDYGNVRNRRPAARATAPKTVFAGAPVVFDASDSSDPDGDNLRFTWVFDDGERAEGVNAVHAFATVGYHVVTLVVTDGRDGIDTTTMTVDTGREKENLYPVADVAGPYAGVVETPVVFKAAASDPDGDELTFLWDFGDGTKESGAAPKHTYARAGTYPVTLMVSDGNGDVTTRSTTVTVSRPRSAANRPPTANAGGPYSGAAGRPVTFDGRASVDVDNDALEYAWTFGDGTTGRGATVNHVYERAGTYTPMLLVSDAKGATAAALATTTIRDR